MTTDRSPLIGCLITAAAPGRRALTGVVLPPSPRSRTGNLRVAIDGRSPAAFDPELWTITILAGPLYHHGNLPAQHLATRTMLRTEMRRQPAPGQKPVAQYRMRRDAADLYAVADTHALADLSPARAAAWTDARTCSRCHTQTPRPIPEHPAGHRYCIGCRKALAFERWCEQSRRAQADAAAWAREVLADPAAALIAHDGGWDIRRMYAETIEGTVLLDARVRHIDDLSRIAWHDETPEQVQARAEKYAGTVGRTALVAVAAPVMHARLIGWSAGAAGIGHDSSPLPQVTTEDVLSHRLALFSGVAPFRSGAWHPEPRLPWSFYPPTYLPYTAHRDLHCGGDPARELRSLRQLLQLMATGTPPAPAIHRPDPVRITTRR